MFSCSKINNNVNIVHSMYYINIFYTYILRMLKVKSEELRVKSTKNSSKFFEEEKVMKERIATRKVDELREVSYSNRF